MEHNDPAIGGSGGRPVQTPTEQTGVSMERECEGQVRTTIAVIGAGYVGLTTAACLAHLGHRVNAVDIDGRRVQRLQSGECPILEDGLPALIREGLDTQRLWFTTEAATAVRSADFVFLCVPTPQDADGAPDLSFVKQASAQIAPHLKAEAIVVNKSTVPVGSAGSVTAALCRPDTVVVSNPEFLREGHAVQDWMNPDRIVIGCENRRAAERLARLYEPLGAPCLITDPTSSETVKYACNAFLAAKVSFVNAIAQFCALVGADAVDVIQGMAYDRRIGADHLAPGPGWGGSCFPKDTNALISIAEARGYDFALLKEVIASNEHQFDWVADQVEAAAGGRLEGRAVAAWGLTFKAGTDDLRDSPALAVLRRLRKRGAALRAYDPSLPESQDSRLIALDIEMCADPYTACEDADALVVLTEWPEFAELDFPKVAAVMGQPSVVDTRNVLDAVAVRAAGLSYRGMGRA
jgi:UDPglucose 6-dehydrogenase